MPCTTHEGHSHAHGSTCGHTPVEHEGHTDYLHEGHMHHMHEGHADCHEFADTSRNPNRCTPSHACGEHENEHVHGPACGHEAVPHAGHMDYLVGGHLHHQHGSHCDDHGEVAVRLTEGGGA